MNKKELVIFVSRKAKVSEKTVEDVLFALNQIIYDALSRGCRVPLYGLGTFSVKRREARKGRNPATNEIIEIPERYVPTFKISSTLKNIVKDSKKML